MAPYNVGCCGLFVAVPSVLVFIATLLAVITIEPHIGTEASANYTKKPLVPRPYPQDKNVDAFIVIDGSSSMSAHDFEKAKQVCLALAARIRPDAQVGLIQFSSSSQMVHKLSVQRDSVERSIINMRQMGGGTNLDDALLLAYREFGLSQFPKNKKEIWIVTDGNYDRPSETALTAQKLRRESQATIYAIGVGYGVSKISMDRVASGGCSFLVDNFDSALNLVKRKITHYSLSVQTNLEILLPKYTYKFGENVLFSITVENVGEDDIQKKSRIIFHDNLYFKQKDVILTDMLRVGKELTLEFKLVPKNTASVNLDEQISNLPSVLEFSFLNSEGNEVITDFTGYMLQHEHFIGDFLEFSPVYAWEPVLNVLLFGPPGAGKSTFVDSMLTALGDRVRKINIAGGNAKAVTEKLERFPIHNIPGFENLKFNIFDVPGIDGKNYKGDEISLLVHGVMPSDVHFKDQAVRFHTIAGKRGTHAQEWARRTHLVMFFVPQGAAGDSQKMERLAEIYSLFTVEMKRKAVVVIAHADEITGEEERKHVATQVGNKLAIGTNSIYFLENYVDAKEKTFHLDKQILRILMAMLNRGNDFLLYEYQNPVVSPYGTPPQFGYKNAN